MGDFARRLARLDDENLHQVLYWSLQYAVRVGDTAFVHERLTTFDYLAAKLREGGNISLVADFELVLNPLLRGDLPHDPAGVVADLELLRDALRLADPVLNEDPSQLGGQLVGRLNSSGSPGIARLLDQIGPAEAPLRPCQVSLPRPALTQRRVFTGHRASVECVAASPRGPYAVSGSDDRTVRWWNVETGACIVTLAAHRDTVNAVACTPDSERVVTGSDDGTCLVWSPGSNSVLHTMTSGSGAVKHLGMPRTGTSVLTVVENARLQLWDIEEDRQLYTFEGRNGWITGLAIGADALLAIATSTGVIEVRDLNRQGKVVARAAGLPPGLTVVRFSRDGRTVVAATNDGTCRHWRYSSGRAPEQTAGPSFANVGAAALAATGRRVLAYTGNPGEPAFLDVVDLPGNTPVYRLGGHTDWVRDVAITPNGQLAVSGSDDTTLRVWDLEQGDELAVLSNGSRAIQAVAMTPTGSRIISASTDGSIRLWDLASRSLVRPPLQHPQGVTGVALLSDGRHAVISTLDSMLLRWDWQQAKELDVLVGHAAISW